MAGIVSSVLTVGGYPIIVSWWNDYLQMVEQYAYNTGWDTLVNNDATHADSNWRYTLAAYVQRDNPVWDNLVDMSVGQPYSNLVNQGNLGLTDNPFSLAVVTVNRQSPKTNKWWGTNTFAKYGLFGFGAESTHMPVLFINLTPCSFAYPGIGSSYGFMYACFQDSIISVITYPTLKPVLLNVAGTDWPSPAA